MTPRRILPALALLLAALRGSVEGTVKAHLSAIYRKAGVSGRGALLGLFIEDLLDARPLEPTASPAPRNRA